MNDPQPVTVKEAYYDKATDTVCWVVAMENGKEAEVFWLREEFGPTFNISPEIPEALIVEFCSRMVGKNIKLIVGG
jgi:hypothetical protein